MEHQSKGNRNFRAKFLFYENQNTFLRFLAQKLKQAEAELGQAQLKLGLDYTLIFCLIWFL